MSSTTARSENWSELRATPKEQLNLSVFQLRIAQNMSVGAQDFGREQRLLNFKSSFPRLQSWKEGVVACIQKTFFRL
ncbi:hypothetical protein E4U54_001407 [Claviceps lovelessii]|nr:hypothetical protein E4U54_001407 [Claviceps lovelessii]